jgi:peptide/nickel transport system substrate-binding protein
VVARPLVLAAAIAAALLAVSGAGGSGAQTPQRGGTLVIGARTIEEPDCLNVFACALSITLPSLLGEVLPGAFELMPDATFRPNLVSRADIVSRSPHTVVYRIRPEARWSDGVPVTASDFVFTDRVRQTHAQADDWHRTYVRSVRPLDPKTVRVVMRERFADWRYLFDVILPRHALAGGDFKSLWQGEIDNPKTGRPIGSGPFLLAAWQRGKQLTFVRNPRYWGPHPAYLDRLAYRFLPPGDVAGALRRGEIDMIDPTPAGLAAVAAEFHRQPAPGIRVVHSLCACIEYFSIRIGPGGHPVLRGKQGKLLRQALAYGIDRVAIARTIGGLRGASGAALTPSDSVVYLPNSPYYRPNWRRYRHRPAESRRLLVQAGCRLGHDGFYSCAGDRLSLRFVTAAGVEERKRTVELAQAHLRRVGIEVKTEFAPPGTLFPKILPSGDFDVALFAVGSGVGGPVDILGCQRPFNSTGYCDRLITRDLVQATRILDDSRRVGLLNRIDARLANAVPVIPLFQVGGFFAFTAKIRGVVPNGPGSFVWNAEDWWLDR